MSRIVVLAEKPSVAKEIARILGCRSPADGYVYNDQYIVTWAIGHLVSLMQPDQIDEKYQKWNRSDLPILPNPIPLQVLDATKKQFDIVKKIINDKDTKSLICATDAGREGELIFRLIYTKANCKKPFERLWISSMTDAAIREGFRTLQPGSNYDNLYAAAKCRQEADWLVGMNASRAYSISYNSALNIGRVKTPTLALIVARDREIENFKPTTFATLTANFGKYSGVFFSDKLDPDTHIMAATRKDGTTASATDIADTLGRNIQGKPSKVVSAETQRKQDLPPQLYDLTSLQRDANRAFGFTADHTLELAQSLYEKHKALTYPRTDSKYLPDDMIPRVVETMKALPKTYQPLIAGALPGGKLNTSKRTIDASKVSDHHAILPTNQTADMSKMSDDEKKLFDTVARRMLAAFYPPCVYDATKIITQVDRHMFRTTGRTVISNGWRDVVAGVKELPADEEENAALPPIKNGETGTVISTETKEGTTKPPARYNDASLLTAMERAGNDSEDEEIAELMKGHGIGTPATRAAIIEAIIKNQYVERKGRQLISTDRGRTLVDIVPDIVKSAELTGRWEKALDDIANGRRQTKGFMDGIVRFVDKIIEESDKKDESINTSNLATAKQKKKAQQYNNTPKSSIHEGLICPLCKQGAIRENTLAFFCSRHFSDGCQLTIWKNSFERKKGPTITADLLSELFTKRVIELPYGYGRITLDDDKISFYQKGSEEPDATAPFIYTPGEKKTGSGTRGGKRGGRSSSSGAKRASSANTIGCKCPVCGKGDVRENDKSFGCTEYKGGCNFTIWKNALSRGEGPDLTKEMVAELLTNGEVKGSYGTIRFDKSKQAILFYKPNEDRYCWSSNITYTKK